MGDTVSEIFLEFLLTEKKKVTFQNQLANGQFTGSSSYQGTPYQGLYVTSVSTNTVTSGGYTSVPTYSIYGNAPGYVTVTPNSVHFN